jgi:hypothetical protein
MMMRNSESVFIETLRAYGEEQTFETRRDLLTSSICVSDAADDCRWFHGVGAAVKLVNVIAIYPEDSPRTKLLAGVALAFAEALTGDIGDVRAPKAAPSPIRQYKDD